MDRNNKNKEKTPNNSHKKRHIQKTGNTLQGNLRRSDVFWLRYSLWNILVLYGWSRSLCFIRKNTNGLSEVKENDFFVVVEVESSLQIMQLKCLCLNVYGLNVYRLSDTGFANTPMMLG